MNYKTRKNIFVMLVRIVFGIFGLRYKIVEVITCPACNGSGTDYRLHICEECEGTGVI